MWHCLLRSLFWAISGYLSYEDVQRNMINTVGGWENETTTHKGNLCSPFKHDSRCALFSLLSFVTTNSTPQREAQRMSCFKQRLQPAQKFQNRTPKGQTVWYSKNQWDSLNQIHFFVKTSLIKMPIPEFNLNIVKEKSTSYHYGFAFQQWPVEFSRECVNDESAIHPLEGHNRHQTPF